MRFFYQFIFQAWISPWKIKVLKEFLNISQYIPSQSRQTVACNTKHTKTVCFGKLDSALANSIVSYQL